MRAPRFSSDRGGRRRADLYEKRRVTYDQVMTKDQIKEVLDRVLTWPPERQQDAAQLLLELEAREGEFYHPDDEELGAIEEGLAEARRGEFVSANEIATLLKL
jgi:predicted transcriptional regulator